MEDKILQYIKETKIDDRLEKPYFKGEKERYKFGKTYITTNEMIDIIKKPDIILNNSFGKNLNFYQCLLLFYSGFCVNNKSVKENKILEITIKYYHNLYDEYYCKSIESQYQFYDIEVLNSDV